MQIKLLVIPMFLACLSLAAKAGDYYHIYANGYLNGKIFYYETDNWEGDE